ncbi:MAG: cobyric acid synthase CobQ [Rhodospirillaceae bacterium]|nr:cobyric acid synthase CobQ [Rhodospirillaceae bacterium]OUT79228.1 MAG: cobyric acid synthase CobQ [Rhodospirillaceae bacterium TMED23]|tara:strand:- start:6715 stop:8160 length:1446 start_codon:yes stop_codon:yes gene_type:complete
MFQGTGSDVGKSLVVAGICRLMTTRGLKVKPFKPQNMSNNAAVTKEGGEIGRAQALQAKACRVSPSIDMNPILLKPQSEIGAQLIILGKVDGNYPAKLYQEKKIQLLPLVIDAVKRLEVGTDLIIVEGAGSAAEVNLRDNDIANMGYAVATQTPVILVADIDRGGVIASIVGTWELLPKEERNLVAGYIINKFRGDVSLFKEAIELIFDKTGLHCYGILPFMEEAIKLPQEDAHTLDNTILPLRPSHIKIIIPRLAHISNFDDFDPLLAEPDVDLQFINRGNPLPGDADLIILPGSKTTIPDLADFRKQGWDVDISAHIRRGGHVLGLCAGYQMLGRKILDPNKIESDLMSINGLGVLDVDTEIGGDKSLSNVIAHSNMGFGMFTGYEMHLGVTSGPDDVRPFCKIDKRNSGAVSNNRRVMGCYLHGLFENDKFRNKFLFSIKDRESSGINYDQQTETALDSIANILQDNLDIEGLLALVD